MSDQHRPMPSKKPKNPTSTDKDLKKQSKAPARRTSPPRPDQLTDETIEFLTALDLYKRQQMRSFLRFEEIFPVLEALGYSFEGDRKALDDTFNEALDQLREESGRLFPSWSEVFGATVDMGWSRGT
jgi:hypothetical protein